MVKPKKHLQSNIIIPLAKEGLPDKNTVEETEKRVYNVLKKANSKVTITKTSATEKGNYVIKFKNDNDIVNIKQNFISEFGNKIKISKPLYPKIKVVSVPKSFPTENKNDVIQT